MSKNSVTYWLKAKAQMEAGLKTCQRQNRQIYTNAVKYATKKIKTIRARAGIYI